MMALEDYLIREYHEMKQGPDLGLGAYQELSGQNEQPDLPGFSSVQTGGTLPTRRTSVPVPGYGIQSVTEPDWDAWRALARGT